MASDGETVLKSVVTDKYVRPIQNARLSPDGKGDPIMYLEKATSTPATYHIKCHETKKYWQVKSGSDPWITADADETNESQRSSACTLFRIDSFAATPATTTPAGKTVRLRHDYLQTYVSLCQVGDGYCLRASSKDTSNDSKDVFVCEKVK
ncbi:unnamed protein product [Camellia sinensis]|uniref:Agglutinin domain-containing protein n=1 Tax=Camellia sinensis TaxID=4442 RepID=A0A7J7G8F3_CAMSI|nr:hypothetical protein HYC85_024548 [Camellia sinensis]